MATVKSLDMLVFGVQVSHGVVGIEAFTNNKSFDVHELAAGKVCADPVETNKIVAKKTQVNF